MKIFAVMLCLLTGLAAEALTWHSGRLVVRLTEPDGTPITNAAVSVRTLARYALNAGGSLTIMARLDQWPNRDSAGNVVWEHSDIKNLAYYYVFKFFDRIVGGE